MPNLSGLVSQISDSLVQKLAAANYPPLVATKILLGRQHLATNDTPPKVVFIPKTSAFGAPDPSGAQPVLANLPYDAEKLRQISNRPIATDTVEFEVHCWGTTSDRSDPTVIRDEDYDYTQQLYQGVIAATDDVARGAFELGPGKWTDETQLLQLGREFVFSMRIHTPVLTELLQFVPPGTVGVITTNLQALDGSTEQGCTG